MLRARGAPLASLALLLALAGAVGFHRLPSNEAGMPLLPGVAPAWVPLLGALLGLAELAGILAVALLARLGQAPAAPGAGRLARLRSWLAADGSWLALALGLRAAAAVAFHFYGLSISPRALVMDDESAYDIGARTLLGLVAQPNVDMVDWYEQYGYLQTHYLWLVAALYGLAGPSPLLARLAGVALGTVAVALAASIARSLSGRRAALAVGLLLAAMPSLVVWSSMVLREALVSALALLVFWGALRWRSAPSWTLAVLVVASLHVLAVLRLYVGLALGMLLLAALLWHLRTSSLRLPTVNLHSRTSNLRPALALAALALLAGLGALVLGPWLLDTARPTRVLYYQTVMELVPTPYEALGPEASGAARVPPLGGPVVAVRPPGSQLELPGMVVAWEPASVPVVQGRRYFVAISRETVVAVDAVQTRPIHLMDPGAALWHLATAFPAGLSAALFAPLSTGVDRLAYALLGVDALIWLGLLALALAAAWRARQPDLLLPLGFVGLVLLVLALVPGHPGNLVRHRAVLTLPVLAIVAGPVLAALADRLPQLRGRAWAASRGPIDPPDWLPARDEPRATG